MAGAMVDRAQVVFFTISILVHPMLICYFDTHEFVSTSFNITTLTFISQFFHTSFFKNLWLHPHCSWLSVPRWPSRWKLTDLCRLVNSNITEWILVAYGKHNVFARRFQWKEKGRLESQDLLLTLRHLHCQPLSGFWPSFFCCDFSFLIQTTGCFF